MREIILSNFLLILFLYSGCASKPDGRKAKLHLRILHTNDHHGHYLQDKDGQYGMAPRKTLIDRLRTEIYSKKNGGSLLLSGGDINTGTMESDIFDAKPDFLGMKYIGYDAMAVGNHEFDNDFKVLKEQEKWAGFPFLSANIFYKKSGKRVFEPAYIIRDIKGVKVGIFGLTTIDTPFKASSDDAKKLFTFKPIIEAAKEVVEELKTKTDIIIAVTHIGHYGSTTSNGDIALAKAVDGIDVIVGGHSQEIINAEEHNGTLIVQAEDWGKYVGVLDLYLDKNLLKYGHDYRLEPVNLKKRVGDKKVLIGNKIQSDPTLNTLFQTYKIKADAIGKKVVGEISGELSGLRTDVRSKQMPIGQFVGESVSHQVKGVDLVVVNGGSIRASLSKGKVSRKDLHNVHPYGNTIATVSFTPEELFEYMKVVAKYAVVDPNNLIGGYPQVSFAKLTVKNGELLKVEAKNGKWSVENKNGKIISKKKQIVLATMNFLAKGGDNYPRIVDHKTYNDSGYMINSAMMNYAEKVKLIRIDEFEKRVKNKIIEFK